MWQRRIRRAPARCCGEGRTGGYTAVSIADLTAASGVSNGTIYHHFGAKDGVLAELPHGVLLPGLTDEAPAVAAAGVPEAGPHVSHPAEG
ncbi:TetR/AcrR family transcriptional regulator [Nocardia nova]|uniref:TetR/AcrR family transcriptional regulator n=1 Tax=Nocardia nova TaxID=37330 RepID=UPI001C67FA30|nr:TetR/AcrR family transcriptional regulator [Nocardia nova]